MVCRGANSSHFSGRINNEMTDFQKRVYSVLKLIPRGKVTTYKILGDFIGCRSAQAIGQALTRNPDAPGVPCHRVIRTDGTIGGYAFGVSEKRNILEGEGVYFDSQDNLLSMDNIYYFI
ncbi:MGMT family protein [Candidatus Gracilibacteria bacterium]|nr:MGMT family protein [Candidatus Gracilibacteria bacterium]